MKILFLAHSFPWPLHEGIRLHVYHLLKELSAWHEIHFCCFIEPEEEAFIAHIQPFCHSITTIPHKPIKSPLKRFWNIIGQEEPYSVLLFQSETMKEAVQSLLENQKPDVFHVDFGVMAPYAQLAPDIPKLFFSHDAMSMLFRRNVLHERKFVYKLYMASQAQKMAAFEKKVLPWFKKTVVVSPVDRDVLQAGSPKADIVVIPNGVDSNYFSPQPEKEKNDILFRGILSFLPNLDAAFYFGQEVMPKIWKESPETTFTIVGHNPPAEVQKLAAEDRRIRLRGFVEDIRQPTAETSVVACPMRIGSGIKNKILESMAMAKAVVATPMSLAAIEAKPGKEILVGETPAELAQQCLTLLKNKEQRQQMGEAARQFILQHHSWTHHAEQFSKLYQEMRGTS